MRTGKLAGKELTSTGWTLVYTVPSGENGVVSIRAVSKDGTAVDSQIAIVKGGNGGTLARVDADMETGLIGLASSSSHGSNADYHDLVLNDVGVGSLDDIYAYASVADKVVVSVNTTGLTYKRNDRGARDT